LNKFSKVYNLFFFFFQVKNKRDVGYGFLDFLEDKFGLGGVKDTINSLSSSIKGNLINVLEDLLFSAGKVKEQAAPVLADLVSELKDHTDDAAVIVQNHISSLKDILKEAGNYF
jgi:hypothetical protein